jgi:hypothetical protein
MRSLPTRLALGLILGASAAAGACSFARLAGLPATSDEIRAQVRTGGRYRRTEGDSLALLHLVNCTQPPRDDRGHQYAMRGQRTVARNESGDAVEIAANAVPPGTHVKIVRPRGRPYRWVLPSNGHRTSEAALTIDLHGCAREPGFTVVYWTGRRWVDVGGEVRDSAITVQLPHLSIYAVAGGAMPVNPQDPNP